jgi:hypothetical protein
MVDSERPNGRETAIMSDVLRFEIAERPLGVNNLYANGSPKKTLKGKTYVPRVASRESKAYKERIRRAALDACADQGWPLDYCGTITITIIDYRKGSQGTDIDGMSKAIQDAIQPRRRNRVITPLGDDREIWASRVYIGTDENERIVVIVRKTTRAAIDTEARRVDLQAFGEAYSVMPEVESPTWTAVRAEAKARTANKPRTLAQMKQGEYVTFAERDALREAGILGRR